MLGACTSPPHTQHGLSSNKMALITSHCGAMRTHEHQMALITSECVRNPSRGRPAPCLHLPGLPVPASRPRRLLPGETAATPMNRLSCSKTQCLSSLRQPQHQGTGGTFLALKHSASLALKHRPFAVYLKHRPFAVYVAARRPGPTHRGVRLLPDCLRICRALHPELGPSRRLATPRPRGQPPAAAAAAGPGLGAACRP